MLYPGAFRPSTRGAVLAAVVALLSSGPAWAVDLAGTLQGQVHDEAGLPVPGVKVVIQSPALQGARTATTDQDGNYFFMALPVGEYQIQVESSGFHPTRGRARVNSGLSSRLDVTMVLETVAAEMIVEDVRPPLDATNARTGIVLSKAQLKDIPNSGRDYQSVMSFSPGVVGSGNPNMRGGLSYGNQYFVDGVNTTDPVTNTFSMNMNYDAIEEFQVITGGMDAEYGRAMGGAVNIVTRSGGNEFEGDAMLLYSNSDMQVYKPLPEEKGVPVPENANQMLAVNLGGPIVKDKLWYFVGTQLSRNLYTPAMTKEIRDIRPTDQGPVPTRDWKSAYLFGKLTWQPVPKHRFWLHAQADPTNIDNASASPYVLQNAETWWRQGGWLTSLRHQWIGGKRTVADTQVAFNKSYIVTGPMQWKDCKNYDKVGVCEDDFSEPLGSWFPYDADGFQYGTTVDSSIDQRYRGSLTSSVTHLASFLGDHRIKAGVQADLLSTYTVYPGYARGFEYWTHNGDPSNLEGYTPELLVKYDSNSEANFKGNIVGWYVQDVWNPVPRITIRPGLRLEHSAFYNNANKKVYSSVNLMPRIGFAADLDGQGKTALHAYYGRFYDPAFLSVASILAKDLNGGGYYPWTGDEWSDEPSYAFADNFLKHPDLKTPVSDEFDLGVSRDLGGGWLVDVNFSYEMTRNLFEDDEVNLIWNDDGTQIVGSRDGGGEATYRLRTPDEAFMNYTSLEFSGSRQFDEHWGMFGSYTWSRSYGRARDDQNQGLASAGMDITQQNPLEVGLMPYDVPHNIKLAGSWRDEGLWEIGKARAGLLMGWNFSMASGYPYRAVYWNDAYGSWNNYQEGITGDYRLPAVSSLDLKAGMSLGAGRSDWALTVECFNVLNDRTITAVETAYDDPGGGPYLDPNGNPWFGQPVARQQPRNFQIGLRATF